MTPSARYRLIASGLNRPDQLAAKAALIEAAKALEAAHTIARHNALLEAAKLCEKARDSFLSVQYAVDQPWSSVSERFGANACRFAILKAIGIERSLPEPPETP